MEFRDPLSDQQPCSAKPPDDSPVETRTLEDTTPENISSANAAPENIDSERMPPKITLSADSENTSQQKRSSVHTSNKIAIPADLKDTDPENGAPVDIDSEDIPAEEVGDVSRVERVFPIRIQQFGKKLAAASKQYRILPTSTH
jgi:hypothetical protein